MYWQRFYTRCWMVKEYSERIVVLSKLRIEKDVEEMVAR